MISAPLPEDEEARQKALDRYRILDTPSEEDYDDIVKLASEICETPITLISLIDMHRQWFKSRLGLDDAETPRDIAFCTYAILDSELFMVPDAENDERFHDNPLVTNDPNIRFYAGMPLITPDGFRLGTLCVIDRVPRELNDFQKNALKVLSRQVVGHLDRRLKVNQLNEVLQTINEQHNKLEDLYRANTRMLSIVGHDLRAPLSTLKSMLEMFSEEYITAEDAREIASKLSDSYEYTQELIDNLMGWARRQFTGSKPEMTEVDIHEKVEDCFRLMEYQAAAKNNALVNTIPKGSVLNTEGNMVYFMIRNLLNNANKFTQEGTITASLETTASEARITITDTGLGIPEEKLTKLFSWDSKMSTYGTGGEKGSGLGLSMSFEFAQKLGGRIEVSSQVGKGSAFSVVLPIL